MGMGDYKLLTPKESINNGLQAAYNPIGALKDLFNRSQRPKAKSAAELQADVESARQAQVAEGVRKVDSIYDSPERALQRQDFLKATRQNLSTDLTKQHTDAARNLKFSTARSGLTGGSADVDSKGQLNQDYQRGLVDTERQAQASFADLVGADETSRAANIGMVQSGLDTGSAAARAGAALSQNLQKSNSTATRLGNVFEQTGNVWKDQAEKAEKRKALIATTGGLYGSNPWG